MQEVLVFILFFGVIGMIAYKWWSKPKDSGCAHCDFNSEKGK